MRRSAWQFTLSPAAQSLPAEMREELARLDDRLFEVWNLGENVLLGWTHSSGALLVVSVRHHVIPEYVNAGVEGNDWNREARRFVNGLLAGAKYFSAEEFHRIRRVLTCRITAVRISFGIENELVATLVSDMVRRYSVSLVGNRAVMLLDAVRFSLQPPLNQMAMLNSLAYSVNSAYGQLLSKNIQTEFARTTTGDGFYIWNRATSAEANMELYKLMMMILADNAVAQRKARSPWVPRLRAAFHVGEHYEFPQVDGVNPTTFSYIVGRVTVDLARMLEGADGGQILLGDFVTQVDETGAGGAVRYDTLSFVENTAATLDQMNGLDVSGGRISSTLCYLTGPRAGDGRFMVNRYHLRDKHGAMRVVYNAKINIRREGVEPILLGLRSEDLEGFNAVKVEPVSRNDRTAGTRVVRPPAPRAATGNDVSR